jgi:hypothetical protein
VDHRGLTSLSCGGTAIPPELPIVLRKMTARARVRTTAEEGAGSPAGGSCLAGPATPAAGRKGWLVQLESFVGEDGMKLAELWWSIASDPTRRDSDRLEASRLLGNRSGASRPTSSRWKVTRSTLRTGLRLSAASHCGRAASAASGVVRVAHARRRRSRRSRRAAARGLGCPVALAVRSQALRAALMASLVCRSGGLRAVGALWALRASVPVV